MVRIGWIAIDVASTMRTEDLASLIGCRLGIVAPMAQGLQVAPIQPALRCSTDIDDVIDVFGLAPAATADRVRLAIGSTQAAPWLATVEDQRIKLSVHAHSPISTIAAMTIIRNTATHMPIHRLPLLSA